MARSSSLEDFLNRFPRPDNEHIWPAIYDVAAQISEVRHEQLNDRTAFQLTGIKMNELRSDIRLVLLTVRAVGAALVGAVAVVGAVIAALHR